MDVEVLEVVLALLHLQLHLLYLDKVAADAIDAVHVEALGLDGRRDLLDKRGHGAPLALAQLD